MTLKVSGWFPFGYFHSALDSILFCLSMNTFFSSCYIKSSCQAVVWPWLYICMLSCSLVADSFWYYGLYPASLLPPWDPPGNTGVGCHLLLQGIFLIQELNLSPYIGKWILYHWATREAPWYWLGGVHKIIHSLSLGLTTYNIIPCICSMLLSRISLIPISFLSNKEAKYQLRVAKYLVHLNMNRWCGWPMPSSY